MQQATSTQDRNLITLGNLTVDAETGEIIEQPEAFQIDTPDRLSWWLGKMRQLRVLADSEKELATRATARARALDNAADHLEALYHDEAEFLVKAMLPKGRRSILLDGGEAGFLKTRGSIVIRDAVAALTWCRQHLPSSIKTQESLLKTPIAAHFDGFGTLPPGVEQVPASEKMWVR